MSKPDYSALLQRMEAVEREFGDLTHVLNEAVRDTMNDRANSSDVNEMLDTMAHSYDLANAARQARAIEGLISVMRYMVSEAAKDTPNP